MTWDLIVFMAVPSLITGIIIREVMRMRKDRKQFISEMEELR